MAPENPVTCSGSRIDLSFWDEHKGTLRRLYLVEGKPLRRVIREMETCHGLPKIEPCVYEVVLRDHFQYRKNLDCKQWLLVDRELAKQNQRGQRCVVLLCGMQLKPNLVIKKIRRAKKESPRKYIRIGDQDQLPDFVQIVAFEPVQGSTTLSIKDKNAPWRQTKGASSTRDGLKPYRNLHPDSSPSSISPDLFELKFGFMMDFTGLILDFKVEQAYAEIQTALPSKQLIRHLKRCVGERLAAKIDIEDSAYNMLGYKQLESAHGEPLYLNQSYPSPRIFGKNSSVDFLENACSKLSNGYADAEKEQGISTLLEWIGRFADISLLKEFFRLECPAVVALWWDLMMGPTQSTEQHSVLIEVGLAVREAEWFQYEFDTDFFNFGLVYEQNHQAERTMDVWVTTTLLRGHYTGAMQVTLHRGIRRFTEDEQSWMMRIWVESRKRLGIDSLDLEAEFGRLFFTQDSLQLHTVTCLFDVAASGDADFSWVPSSMNQIVSKYLRGNLPAGSLPRFTWKRMQYLHCLHGSHATSKQRAEWLEIVVMVWSIYTAARTGLDSLEEQKRLCFYPITPEYAFALQMTLSEAIGTEDLEAVKCLLEFGIDPNTPLLPVYEATDSDNCLSALPRAAGLRNPDILAVLIDYGADLSCLRPFSLHLAVANVEPLTQHSAAKLWETIALLLKPHGRDSKMNNDINGPLNVDIGTLHLTMRTLGRLETVQAITPHQYHFVLTGLFPTDTLRQAIRFSCSLAAVRSLTSSGMKLGTENGDQQLDLIHDALLARSIDRYSIVKILLNNRTGLLVDCEESSLLVAALRSTATPDLPTSPLSISRWRHEQKQSLRLFDEILGLGAQAPANVQLLLSLLLVHRCPTSTFKRIVEAYSGPGPLGKEYGKLVVYSIALDYPGPAEWLIEKGVDVSMGTYRKRSAIWTACAKKASESFIRLLIKKGGMVEPSLAPPGRTPLHIVASKGYMAIASLLLSHGALINTESKTLSGEPLPMTALDWAATMGRLDMVKFLVECGGQSACKGLTDFDGAFWHARGHLGILNLFERGAGYSFPEVMSSLRRTFPDVLESERDIIDLTRYEDWDSETDWAWSDWIEDDKPHRSDTHNRTI